MGGTLTTFSHAYHASSTGILEGRKAFARIKHIMESLEGKAFETANEMVRKEYAATQSVFHPGFDPFLQLRLGQSISPLAQQIAVQRQFALLAQNRRLQHPPGILGGLGNFL